MLEAPREHLALVRRFHETQVREDLRHVGHGETDETIPNLPGELERRRQRIVDATVRIEHEPHAGPSRRERIEEARRLLRADRPGPAAVEHRGHERLELAARQDGLDTGSGPGLLRAEKRPGPMFLGGIAILDEQNLAARLVARHQDQHRVGLRDAGQVIKVAVLAVFVVHVIRIAGRRRTPENQHRLGAQTIHDARPAGGQIVAELAGPRGRSRRERDDQRRNREQALARHECAICNLQSAFLMIRYPPSSRGSCGCLDRAPA